MNRHILIMLLLMLTIGYLPLAHAGEDKREVARVLNKEAKSKFNLGEYATALEMFKQAYGIYPEPHILYNMGQAYRRLKQYDRASESFRAYLREAPEAPDRAAVTKMIADLEKEKERAARPKDAGTKEAIQIPISFQLRETNGSTDDNVISGPWYDDGWGWVLAGSGATAVAVGIGFFVASSDIEGRLATANEVDRRALLDEQDRDSLVGTLTTIVGGGLLLAGVVKLAIADQRMSQRRRNDESLSLFVGTQTVGIMGHF